MELREKLSNFDHYNESHFQCNTQSFKVSPEGSFNWKLLIIGNFIVLGIFFAVTRLHRQYAIAKEFGLSKTIPCIFVLIA